jgi:hypothetical protein
MKIRALTILVCIFFLVGSADSVYAQKRSRRSSRSSATVAVSEARKAHEQAKLELTKATEEYKKSLKDLLALLEPSAKSAEGDLAKFKQLYNEGLMSKKELEARETALVSQNTKIAEVRKELTQADVIMAQTLAEADVATQLVRGNTATSGIVERIAYFRYDGPARWGLSNAGTIQNFFYSKFHRQLPISAFGQSELHNQMGFDHSNAMDVGLNPDSAEGRALISYLESAGIPFIAFRRAVPGAASGPHIHVGRPSHKR